MKATGQITKMLFTLFILILTFMVIFWVFGVISWNFLTENASRVGLSFLIIALASALISMVQSSSGKK